MNQFAVWKYRLTSRLQAAILVAAMAAMLGLTGFLLGGASMALSISIAVIALYWLQPLLAPRLMLRIQGGRPLSPPEAPELYRIIQGLARRARLSYSPRLFYLPGEVINAFTVGTGAQAIIGVTDGLLRHLNREEVAAVLAHEVAHIRNDDTRVMGFAALLSQLIQGMSLFGQLLLIVNLPLILAGHQFLSMSGLLMLILAPYAGFLLQLALSRSREYLADTEAVALIESAHPLARALQKIEHHNRHLKRRFLRWPLAEMPNDALLRTHPPTRERVRRLLALHDETPAAVTSPHRRLLRPNVRRERCRRYGLCY
jgi:heat shock protein HtpX